MSTLAPRFLLGFTALTAATSCSLVIDTWQEKAVRTDVLEHQADDAFNLRIDGFNGDITVTTAPGVRALTGEATVYARGATQDSADSRLGQMAWSWERDGDTLVLNLSKPSGGSNNAGSTIDNLLVPEGWNVDIHSSNGNISVGAGFERVLVHSSNGSIEATGDGQIRLKSSNGRIRYSGGSKDFNLDTSNGRIELNLMGDWSGNGVVDTSNGSIQVRCTGVITADLETDTSNGKTYIEGPRLSGGSGGLLILDTSNGNINITHGDV
jgi:hypothetical protein